MPLSLSCLDPPSGLCDEPEAGQGHDFTTVHELPVDLVVVALDQPLGHVPTVSQEVTNRRDPGA